jgi:hypothetical protein
MGAYTDAITGLRLLAQRAGMIARKVLGRRPLEFSGQDQRGRENMSDVKTPEDRITELEERLRTLLESRKGGAEASGNTIAEDPEVQKMEQAATKLTKAWGKDSEGKDSKENRYTKNRDAKALEEEKDC